jgi:three-Cys-motif partner protein
MKLDQIGEWSEIKLEIVKRYANEYTRIMTKQDWCKGFTYIDAFAGPGQNVRKTTGEIIPGSPQNALSIEPPFSEYVYIDLDKSKVDELQKIAGKLQNIHVYHGDCNEILINKVFPSFTKMSKKRALCLLDPYGLHLNWDTIKMAGDLGTIEIFLNFSVMDANRNILRKDLLDTRPDDILKMNTFWGDESWKDVIYRKQDDLFGETHLLLMEGFRQLAFAYRERLRLKAGFEFVPEPVLMTNKKNGPLYYLFFASPNKVGNKIVNHIFNKYKWTM